jgi:hypothetical protein
MDLSGKWLEIKPDYGTKKMLSDTRNSMSLSVFTYEKSDFFEKLANCCATVFDDNVGNFRSVYLFRVEMNGEINADRDSDIF